MGPIEFTFLVVVVLFGVVGYVRGYPRELGVTAMLLLALFVLEFIDAQLNEPFNELLAFSVGGGPGNVQIAKALVYSFALMLVVFISYQGETLTFPGSSRAPGLSMSTGLLNGYLLAGSLWFFLGRANWPYLSISEPFSEFYRIAWRVLPPNLLEWPYLIALVVIMLVLRIWK